VEVEQNSPIPIAMNFGILSLLPSPFTHAKSMAGFRAGCQNVLRGKTDIYLVRFCGGKEARVFAVGDGDIDIKVYDSNGLLVDMNDLVDIKPVCSWVPRYTQTYTIQVINRSRRTVDYVIGTN